MITENPSQTHYDVIVIGSGPAGISTALKIAENSSAKIAIIESGKQDHDPDIQALANVTHSGDLDAAYFSIHSQRRFGGTSSIWAGWCAALEKRSFNQGDWPIDYDEIDQFYPEAATILNLSDNAWLYRSSEIAGDSGLVYKPFYFSDTVRFGEKYRDPLLNHSDIELVLNKTCTDLTTSGSAVTSVELQESTDASADPISISANRVVIACGGVGTPRLLRQSGIGLNSPLGQNLMDHPHLYNVADIYLDWSKIAELAPNTNVAHALQLSDEICVANNILSFSVQVSEQDYENTLLLGKNKNLTLTPVTVRSEMASQSENEVSLSNDVDALGQQRSHVDFNFRYNTLARDTWEIFAESLIKSGLGRPGSLPSSMGIAGGGHLIGTTRMGLSETDSVVDRNCKVHSLDNLYIAGSSVFSAGGAANPTYSIVAMALRLGDHISSQMNGGA